MAGPTDLDHTVIRIKLEKLRLELKEGPPVEMMVESRVEWMRAKTQALVEILLYLGK